jgi:ketosteroid isomerase-like protein
LVRIKISRLWRLSPKLDQKEVDVSLEELEKRIQAIEDTEAIKKLHQHYINLMDNIRYDEVPDLFTDDATVEIRQHGVKKGKKEITDIYQMIKKFYKGGAARHVGHMCVEPDIMVDGNTAKGAWLIYLFDSVPNISWVQGINECEYRKINGKWFISKLKFMRTLASDTSMYP